MGTAAVSLSRQTVRAPLITRSTLVTALHQKHVGLRGLWLQEAPVDGKLELEKVDTAMNPTESASCVGLLECTCATVKGPWVTIPTSGI